MLIKGTEIGTSVFVIVQIAEVLRVAVVGVVGRIRVEWAEIGYEEDSTFILKRAKTERPINHFLI